MCKKNEWNLSLVSYINRPVLFTVKQFMSEWGKKYTRMKHSHFSTLFVDGERPEMKSFSCWRARGCYVQREEVCMDIYTYHLQTQMVWLSIELLYKTVNVGAIGI